MRTLIKQYPILSENAHCDLSLVLHNISGPDHVAAKAYMHLAILLKTDTTLKLNLRTVSTWSHALGLAAACKLMKFTLEIHVDAS